jgi:hypothetical protein
MPTQVNADLIVDDGNGGTRQLSTNDFASVRALRLEEASATVTYVGEAEAGTATSAAAWRIKRISTASGTSIQWADGDTLFNNVWDNRAGLTYS